MSGSMQDKRSDPRIPLIAAVEVTEVATGTRLNSRTSDISRTGCYIDTLNPTPVKTVVRVRLTHAGEDLELPWASASTKICRPLKSLASIAGFPARSRLLQSRCCNARRKTCLLANATARKICCSVLLAIPSLFFSCAHWVLPFAALSACSHASSLFFPRPCLLRRMNLHPLRFPFLNFIAASGSISTTRCTALRARSALQAPRQMPRDQVLE